MSVVKLKSKRVVLILDISGDMEGKGACQKVITFDTLVDAVDMLRRYKREFNCFTYSIGEVVESGSIMCDECMAFSTTPHEYHD